MKKNISTQNLIKKRLGLNIKFYRNKLNLTQEEIADMIDAERSYITAIETGTKLPSIYFLYELSKCLKTSLKELLDINIE